MSPVISGNAATVYAGIVNAGILTSTQVSLTANLAGDNFGGLLNFENAVAIFEESVICDNAADNNGDGTGDGGGIYNNLGTLTLKDSTVCGNSAATFGGGIFSNGTLTVSGALFNNNIADDGGALFIEQNADNSTTTTIISSTLDQNIGRQSAGAINNSGLLAVSASTFSGNTAEMFSAGAILNNGVTMLLNTTFSGNTSTSFGGAIRNLDTLTMTNVTIAGNEALAGAGVYNDQDAWLVSTIVADNTGSNCDGVPLTSLGYNLEDADTCNLDPVLNDQINTDPLLGPLADNGGSTLTHALLSGSPAVDAGHNAAAICPPTDQRGAPRPVDGDGEGQAVCDIGAYEYGALLPWLYLPLVLR